jgi:hypothetical protein
MWGGGGEGAARWLPKLCPPPPVGGITPKIGGIAVSHHVAEAVVDAKCPPMVREVSAKCRSRSHVTSVVQGEKTRFLQILFN